MNILAKQLYDYFGKFSDSEIKAILKKQKFIIYGNKLSKLIFKSKKYYYYTEIDTNSIRHCYYADREYYPAVTFADIKRAFAEHRLLSFNKWVISKAISFYGKDRVTIKDDYSFVIYYPEIQITNSYGLVHTMYDLWAKINISTDSNRLYLASLKRTTLSSSEIRNEYLFSHCYINDYAYPFESFDFCYGNSSHPLQSLLKEGDPFLKVDLWFLNLEAYLSWESVEGIPYRYINNVKSDVNYYKQVSSALIMPTFHLNSVINHVISNLDIIDFDYGVGQTAILSQTTIDSIKDIIKSCYGDVFNCFQIDGSYVVIDEERTYEKICSRFEGITVGITENLQVPLKILNTDPTGTSKSEIDEQLIINIKSKIENDINSELYTICKERSL
ncbi:MAG: hypothetical protein EOL97_09010 [Spirochaetia bacterium]|nr:hypothetical protein [Spirochaetia bacterium]